MVPKPSSTLKPCRVLSGAEVDMGFHQRTIRKGVYGELSKVQEELDEALDAEEQGQTLMLRIELSDLIGAIRGVIESRGWDFDELDRFAKLRSKVAKEERE